MDIGIVVKRIQYLKALVDLGVSNAIYLVGSRYSFGWWKPSRDATTTLFGDDTHTERYRNETYIVWN